MNGPCKNPNCHSCGQPHPNCRCYADGGDVLPAFDDTIDVPAQQNTEASSSSSSSSSSSQALPAFEDTIELPGSELPKFEDTIDPKEKYGTTGQRVLGDVEAAASGALGFIPTLVETKLLGMSPEDIKGRAATEGIPGEHAALKTAGFVGSMFAGPAKLIASTVGSKALGLFLQGVSYQGSDEIEKALLNHPEGNPAQAVAAALTHMGINGLLTVGTGGLMKGLNLGLEASQSPKIANAMEKMVASIADDGKPLNKVINKAVDASVGVGAGYMANALGGGPAAELIAYQQTYKYAKKLINPFIEKALGKHISKANSYIEDAVIHSLLKENFLSVPTAMKWGQNIAKGVQASVPAIDALFKSSVKSVSPDIGDEALQRAKDWISGGGIENDIQNFATQNVGAQAFAEGGSVSQQVPTDHFAQLYPAQNALLMQAKGRVSNYLNGLRPLNNPSKLPFDAPISQKEKNRSYEKAVEVAANPLSVLNHVQKGSLTPDTMKHLVSMYPEVYNFLSEKLTKRIAEAQLSGEKPSYAKRQSMSLFLGAALDSSFTPQAIQAAQGVFAQKKAMQQPASQGKTKGNKNALIKTSQNYATDDQAVQKRQQSLKV